MLSFMLGPVQEQAPQDEPPKPILEIPGVKPVEPRPLVPAGDGLTLRAIAFRPRMELTTREFDANLFGRKMNFGDLSGFERTAFGLDATLNAGSWMFSLTALIQQTETQLGEYVQFEQHGFQAGTHVESTSLFGTAEAYYRIGLAGGPTETLQLSLLAGVNFTKCYFGMKSDRATASEGFSALWPVPAAGLEARVWLSDRLAMNLSARGTRLRFDNPFQLDGGGSQDIRYLYGRFDAGLEWTLGERFSVSAGYTGIDAFIDDASAEDTDTADIKTGGLHAGLMLRF